MSGFQEKDEKEEDEGYEYEEDLESISKVPMMGFRLSVLPLSRKSKTSRISRVPKWQLYSRLRSVAETIKFT